jgi:CO/xanthine dehydrogenase Mo-binding subunit
MEGSIIMSLGYTLTEEVSFEGGKVLNEGLTHMRFRDSRGYQK